MACRTGACTSTSSTPENDFDERSARRHGRCHPAAVGGEQSVSRCILRQTHDGCPRHRRRGGRGRIRRRRRVAILCDMLVVSAGIRPNVRLAQRAGLTVERAIVVDDHMRSIDDDNVYVVGECAQHRGQVYGLVAPLWEQAMGARGPFDRHRQTSAVYQGSRMATKLKVAGVNVATMGLKTPEHPDDEFVQFSEPKHGVYKTIVVREGKLVGATLVGDVGKLAFLMQAFDRGLPLPRNASR